MKQSENNGFFRFVIVLILFLFLTIGCGQTGRITKDDLPKALADICKKGYQVSLVSQGLADTLWVYLPYTPGRSGLAVTKEEGNDLYLEYRIASFNPYRTLEPPELKFLVQKVIKEVRRLLLRMDSPYKFFVLVVTEVASKDTRYEDWYIGYFDDLGKYPVGLDFSGEGYSRLVWHREKIEMRRLGDETLEISSYQDREGKHIRYHNVTLREFVEKQIKWRIYKKFTIEYNKTPFDLSAQEKRDEVLNIVQTVLNAYNFEEYEKIYLKDSSFLDEQDTYIGYSRQELEKNKAGPVLRKPAF